MGVASIHQLTTSSEDVGKRVDLALVRQGISLSRTQIQRLIKEGLIRVNQSLVKPHYKLRPGDQIEVSIPPPPEPRTEPEPIPLDIIYEDESVIVLNKPWGLVVHPGAGNRTGTLVNALLWHCPALVNMGNKERPGIVHRLDKDTSGIMVVAKDDHSYLHLARQWQRRSIRREYTALVKGELATDKGEIDMPIGRHPIQRKKMHPDRARGKPAVTQYRVMERFPGFTLLNVTLKTGRTHQIRVHMAYIRHPVVGDGVYGRRSSLSSYPQVLQEALKGLKGQALHASLLGFVHPRTEQYLEFRAPLPEEFRHLLACLSDLRTQRWGPSP